jgi:hypothetical protein
LVCVRLQKPGYMKTPNKVSRACLEFLLDGYV